MFYVHAMVMCQKRTRTLLKLFKVHLLNKADIYVELILILRAIPHLLN